MTWIVWSQQPPYDPNSPYGRTFDPDTGNELFVERTYSDGATDFRISGEDINIRFTGLLGGLSESEKKNLQIHDAIVWNVTSMNRLDILEKRLICEALETFQIAHGLNPRNDVVFLRFDRGILFNA